MRKLQLAVLLFCLVLSVAVAKKGRKNRGDQPERIDLVSQVVEEGAEDYDDEEEEDNGVVRENPCHKKRCNRGELCTLRDDQAVCICREECFTDVDPRYKVCSTKNMTYDTECHLDRDHCYCRSKQPGCSEPRDGKVRLDYFGACKELTTCPDGEMLEFPQRMRDWLFAVMREMANRHELGEYVDWLNKAKEDARHTEAVIWKFCDLDAQPRDRHVTRRELLFIIAAIKPMEHCLVPFLDKCDTDKDNKIDLEEWGLCLGLENGHDTITDKCKDIHRRAKRY